MFDIVKAEVAFRMARADEVLARIDEIYILHGLNDTSAKEMKGLFVVQLYAAYEYCVTQSFRAAVNVCQSHNLELSSVRKETLPLVLQTQFQSIEDGARINWKKRKELMLSVFSNDLAVFDESMFPKDGSHFRVRQLETIWSLFGIIEPVCPDPRLRSIIDEMVEHRNAVAHGRERLETIGGRYTVPQWRDRKNQINSECVYITETLERHVGVRQQIER